MKTPLAIGLVVVLLAAFIGLYLRRRGMSFTGTITDKDIHEEPIDNGSTSSGISISNVGVSTKHTYFIKIQTDSGKTVNWEISEGKYQVANIGDTVSKRAGTTEIEIIASSTASTPPTSAPTPPTVPPPTPPSATPPQPPVQPVA